SARLQHLRQPKEVSARRCLGIAVHPAGCEDRDCEQGQGRWRAIAAAPTPPACTGNYWCEHGPTASPVEPSAHCACQVTNRVGIEGPQPSRLVIVEEHHERLRPDTRLQERL